MSYRKFTPDVAHGHLDFNDDHYYELESSRSPLGIVSLLFDSTTEGVFVAYGVTYHVYESINWAWRTLSWGLETAFRIYEEAINFLPEEHLSSETQDLVVETIADGVNSGNLNPDEDVDSLWSMAIEFMKDNPDLFEEEIYKKFEDQLA